MRELALNRRLPVQDPSIDAPWAQEGSQPPLYYAIGAVLTGHIDASDEAAMTVRNPLAKVGIPLAADNKNMVAHPPGQSPLQGGTTGAVFLVRLFSILLGTATAYVTFRLGARRSTPAGRLSAC